MAHLVFIDTNIFLDFYRTRGGDAGLSLLELIDGHHERIITSGQVEMEFKKNRQRVILDVLSRFKSPSWDSSTVPSFLSEAKAAEKLDKLKSETKLQMARLERRIEAVLKNPTGNDPVYKIVQRLFRSETAVNLSREKDVRFRLRRLAWKRFILGYPPRKADDTSIGDAVNWEWIVHCASMCSEDIVIVSRDSDFGHVHKGKSYINDWLRHEFNERVSRRRKVLLTARLTEGFRLAGIKVTKKEIRDENDMIEEIASSADATPVYGASGEAVLPSLRMEGKGSYERCDS